VEIKTVKYEQEEDDSTKYEVKIDNVMDDIYNDLNRVNMDFNRNNANYLPKKI